MFYLLKQTLEKATVRNLEFKCCNRDMSGPAPRVLAQGTLTLSQVLCVGHGQLVTSSCGLHSAIFPADCLLRGALKVQKVRKDMFISVIRHFKATVK